MATVTQLGPRIRERQIQAALDQAAADRGWPPDPWRLRPRSCPRRGHQSGKVRSADVCPPRLRVVR